MEVKRVFVPDIGDLKDVPVIELVVCVGDTVAAGQSIAIVESEKSTLDIPASEAGIVTSIDVKVGDRISSGHPLMTLRSAKDEAGPVPDTAANGAESLAPRAESGTAATAIAMQGTSSDEAPRADLAAAVHRSIDSEESSQRTGRRVHAGPAVRKLARELGVELQAVAGSGRGGRVTPADVRAFVKSAMPALRDAQATADRSVQNAGQFTIAPWPNVDFEKFGPVEEQPLSRIRKISGANLHRNWVSIPHVTNHDDADVTELEAFRTNFNREHEASGVRVSPLAFIMKACVSALKVFPTFNASLVGDKIVFKRYFHLGFAADTSNGLVVPVIRDVDRKSVAEIAREMAELAEQARKGQLTSAQMQGGCFSISSLGGIGGSYFTPIINAPEVAILGVGRAQSRVAWIDGQARPRLFLPLSLSWDHRVMDGAMAGRFNAYLVKVLGDLRQLLM